MAAWAKGVPCLFSLLEGGEDEEGDKDDEGGEADSGLGDEEDEEVDVGVNEDEDLSGNVTTAPQSEIE